MTEQFQLFAPPADAPDSERLTSLLHRAGGWLKTPQILSRDPSIHSGQRLRAALEHCDGAIISDPALGYRHVERATADEVAHFLASQRSRARKILARYLATRRRAHALIG